MKIKKILKMSQDVLKNYVYENLKGAGYKEEEIINTDSYVYAEGDIPVLLVAHLDTVHKQLPKTILYDKQQKMIWSPEGIGGDDRCGVYAILELIKHFKPYILFPTDEEIGGVGSTQFTKDTPSIPVNFMIEIDRRGCGQSVYYDCGNKEFKGFINALGFEENYGTFSDISILSPAYDIASVNLSAGYYNEHTCHEYINIKDLTYTIARVGAILKIMTDKELQRDLKFDYQEVKYKDYTKIWNDYNKMNAPYEYEEDLYDIYYDDWKKLSAEEWLDLYGYEKPATFKEVEDKMLPFF